MLSYNGINDAFQCAASLETQRSFIDKFLLLDNGSNTENKSLLKSNAHQFHIDSIDSPDNLGFAAGFNQLFDEGLKLSSAEYFLAINNDTEATPEFLYQLLKEALPNRIISPMILWHRDKETVIQSAGELNLTMMKMDNLFEGKKRHEVPAGLQPIGQSDGCCFLIHRSWIEKGFRFDPLFFMYYEDVELFLRLRKAGAKFYYQADAILYHKEYGSSGSRDTPSPLRNYYFYRNRFWLTKIVHSWPKRWRVYWRIYRLATQMRLKQSEQYPLASKAISQAIRDFFKGVSGKGPYP